MKSSLRQICAYLSSAFFLFLTAWNSPEDFQLLKKAQNKDQKLDYMIVEINGKAKVVSSGSDLLFLRGDTIKVREAALQATKKKVGMVELLGVDAGFKTTDIRGKEFSSTEVLEDPLKAVDQEGKKYAVLARSADVIHGFVYLKRVEPTLSYIDVSINEKRYVMRENEDLRVKEEDTFQIVNFVTNIHNNEDVSFVVVPVKQNQKNLLERKFNILFQHKSHIFAQVPLTIDRL